MTDAQWRTVPSSQHCRGVPFVGHASILCVFLHLLVLSSDRWSLSLPRVHGAGTPRCLASLSDLSICDCSLDPFLHLFLSHGHSLYCAHAGLSLRCNEVVGKSFCGQVGTDSIYSRSRSGMSSALNESRCLDGFPLRNIVGAIYAEGFVVSPFQM